MNKSEMTNLVRMRRENLEQKAREARARTKVKMDKLLEKRAKRFIKSCVRTVVRAANDGKTQVMVDYGKTFRDTCWGWENAFTRQLDKELDRDLQCQLIDLIRDHFKGFGLSVHDIYWRLDLVWNE